MTKPRIISEIEKYFKLELKPSKAESPESFMHYGRKEEDKNQYLVEEGKLIGLNLRTNGLTEFPFLEDPALSDLKALYLTENKLPALHLSEQFDSLEYLDISDNETLKELTFDGDMPALKMLDASDCKIERLRLPNCRQLKRLDVSRNVLNTFVFASACQMLRCLDLSANSNLSEVNFPKGFDSLQFAYFYKSGLKKLEVKGALPKLKVLDLEDNQLEEWPEGFLLPPSLETLYLNNNPLGLFAEVMNSGGRENSVNGVREYLASIQNKEEITYLHQAKMILLGNKLVGKSSLREKLLNIEAPIMMEEDRTEGLDIAISPYFIENLEPNITGLDDKINFQLNIWDFGGQDYYREAQQLFCSPKSLYLFVTSYDDVPKNENYVNFNYWIQMVNSISFDSDSDRPSPVIRVKNKIDLEKDHSSKSLGTSETFKNIIGPIIPISCQEKEGFELLHKKIRESVPRIEKNIFKRVYNKHWLRIKDELLQRRSENYISHEEFIQKVCAPELDENAGEALLQLLSNLGEIVYFSGNEKLKKWIIINPNWLKNGIFKVFNSGLENPVSTNTLNRNTWKEYPETDRNLLLMIMFEYDLCFEIESLRKENKQFIFPALLSNYEPDLKHLLVGKPVEIRFIFFPFIPAGTVNKLMVRLREYIPDFQLMWKNNVVFKDRSLPGTYAKVEEDWKINAVNLSLYGKEPSALYILIDETLKKLLTKFKNDRHIRTELKIESKGLYKGDWISLNILKTISGSGFEFLKDSVERSVLNLNESIPTDLIETRASKSITNESNTSNNMAEINELIGQNRLDEAIALLKVRVPERIKNDVSLLEGRYNDLKRRARNGLLGFNEESVQRNRIVFDIMELAKEIENAIDGAGISKPPTAGTGTTDSPSAPPPDSDAPKKVLFICSSPKGQNPLDFGKEYKKIQQARQVADHRNKFEELRIETGVEEDVFLDLITKYQPDILHISLHSSKANGLYFEDIGGGPVTLSTEDFADIISLYCKDPDGKGKLETVVLSSCNSHKYGEAILSFADNVIVTKDFFPDEAAVIYAERFYRMLFNQKDVGYAHESAKLAIKRKKYKTTGTSVPVHEIPVLLKNNVL